MSESIEMIYRWVFFRHKLRIFKYSTGQFNIYDIEARSDNFLVGATSLY